ncbi:MAG: acyl-CoA thioesterase, partial [Verrucomicrobiales bacterium]|nr:acyl-CoA thioesterase [Verrucomicrobiales bacterium]
DMAGIVHFSNFARFMERAEHAFFREVGLSIWEDPAQIPTEDRVAWPRVHFACDFHAPLFFQEEFEVELLVEEIRSKAIRYLFRCWKNGGVLAAEGRMAAACVRKDPATGRMQAVPIPDRIRACFAPATEAQLKRPQVRSPRDGAD